MADDLRAKIEELKAFFEETAKNIDRLSNEQQELVRRVVRRFEDEDASRIRETIARM